MRALLLALVLIFSAPSEISNTPLFYLFYFSPYIHEGPSIARNIIRSHVDAPKLFVSYSFWKKYIFVLKEPRKYNHRVTRLGSTRIFHRQEARLFRYASAGRNNCCPFGFNGRPLAIDILRISIDRYNLDIPIMGDVSCVSGAGVFPIWGYKPSRQRVLLSLGNGPYIFLTDVRSQLSYIYHPLLAHFPKLPINGSQLSGRIDSQKASQNGYGNRSEGGDRSIVAVKPLDEISYVKSYRATPRLYGLPYIVIGYICLLLSGGAFLEGKPLSVVIGIISLTIGGWLLIHGFGIVVG
jgi:hypothetical protein